MFSDLPPARNLSNQRLLLRQTALLEEIERVNTARGRHPVARRVAVPVTAALAVGLGAWAGFSGLATGTPAYASWTPTARTLPPSAVRSESQNCLARLAGMPEPPNTSVMSPVFADRRGEFTAVLVGGQDIIGVCLSGAASWMTGYTPALPLTPGVKLSLDGDGGKTDAPDAARYVYGRTLTSAAQVTVTLTDGSQVTASVRDGYYFAWWPSAAGPVRISAVSATGTLLDTLKPPFVRLP